MRSENKKHMGIYLHIPFCAGKCSYCDFLSSVQTEEVRAQYVDALIKEIKQWSHIYGKNGKNYTVTSIYYGGGTPSILSVIEMENLMTTLRENYNIEEGAEITMECNPGTVDRDKLAGFYQTGIKRLSIGLQSADNEELKTLGRIHTYEEFLDCYKSARKAGFDNISVDVISAVPGQDMRSLENTLEKIVSLCPEHISAYSLIIEENTKFYELYEKDQLELVDEDMERGMYYFIRDYLKEYGYERYEISNFALHGKEALHNSSYWARENYLGMGLGASSLMDEVRFQNISHMKKYMERSEISCQMNLDKMMDSCENVEYLTKEEQVEEFVFLGLRRKEGISLKEFKENFQMDFQERYGKNMEKLVESGYLICESERLMLSDRGIDVSNEIFAKILL